MKRWSVTFEDGKAGTRTTRRFWTRRSAEGWFLFLCAEGHGGSAPRRGSNGRHWSVSR